MLEPLRPIQPTSSKPLGLARLIPKGEARVITPFKHNNLDRFHRVDEGLPNQGFSGATERESTLIWKMLFNPATEKGEILDRQATVGMVAHNSPLLTEVLEARELAYEAQQRIEFLLSSSPDEDRRAEEARERPRNRIEVLIANRFDCSEQSIKRHAISIKERSEEVRNRQTTAQMDHERTLLTLDAVARIQQDLEALRNSIGNIDNQWWKEVATDFQASISRVTFISPTELCELVKKQHGGDKLASERLSDIQQSHGSRLLDGIAAATATIMVANIIAEQSFTKATFNENEPEGFKSGWNFLKEKSATVWRSKTYEHERVAQVCNDSPRPAGEIYLSGSNMSGKSFALDSWFYLKLFGQTFGYIPADSGNIHISSGFCFLHRLGSDVSLGERSSFQTEIFDGWKKVLGGIPANSEAFFDLTSDEAFSTTSPVDQYKLLVGVTKYLRSRGVKVRMATHNGEFLALKQEQPDVAIYHFGVDKSALERIVYTYKLTEGLDISHALDVGRKLGLPPHIIQHATGFLQGEVAPISAPQNTPWRTERYTEREREKLKKDSQSLRFLWPHRSELILQTQEYTEKPQLAWLQPPKDPDSWGGSSYGSDEPDFDAPRETRYIGACSDRLMKEGASVRSIHTKRDPRVTDYLGSLLQFGPSSEGGTQEVFERQQMFKELLIGDRAGKLVETTEKLAVFMWSVPAAFRENLFRAPQKVLRDLADEMSTSGSPLPPQVFLDTMELLRTGFGLTLHSRLIDSALDKLNQLLPVMKESHELCKSLREEENQLSWDEREKLVTQVKVRNGYAPDFDLGHQAKVLCGLIAAQTSVQLSNVTLENYDVARVPENLRAQLADTLEKLSEEHLFLGSGERTILVLNRYSDTRLLVKELLDQLRDNDSVYLQQFANYFEPLFKNTLGIESSGASLLSIYVSIAKAEEKRPYSARDEFPLRESAAIMLQTELWKLGRLGRIAQFIKDENFAKVHFNDTGDLSITNGWSITSEREVARKQIRNSTKLPQNVLCELLESPNGSGKSFYLRERTWLALCGLATGYAPAEAVSMPIFSKVAYLDRVPSDLDQNLSAFGNEVQQWLKLPIHFKVAPENGWLIVVDEAFSSTDPHSQGALSDAVLKDLIGTGNKIFFSSHNHDWARSFAERAGELTTQSHFMVHVNEGKLIYDFAKRPGPAPSLGLEVAEAFGMPEEVIKAASLAPEVSFVRHGAYGKRL